jgi:hypothetical protein
LLLFCAEFDFCVFDWRFFRTHKASQKVGKQSRKVCDFKFCFYWLILRVLLNFVELCDS